MIIMAVGLLRVLFNLSVEISSLALFSPIGGMALFGGGSFNKSWKAFLFPLGTLFLSDVILHSTVFSKYSTGFLYIGWYWVYIAFILMTVAGRLILRQPTVGKFFLAVVAATVIHWLVTDLSMCTGAGAYPATLFGYYDSLIAALPFELRFLGSTLIYGGIMFGAVLLHPQPARGPLPAQR